ncbi:MAG: LysM peptidoglycan-binding domain-containing protein [Candidatus Sungbacteria bacterium]|nr:LysM peptidoglycan-binding domain-containing protein [Candidatus Sungbacteria bacterium]
MTSTSLIAFEKVNGCPPIEYPDAQCRVHKTETGDTLAVISRRYHVSFDAIRAFNPNRREALNEALPKNQTLILPLVNGKDVIAHLKKEISEEKELTNALEKRLITLAEERDQAIQENNEQKTAAAAFVEKKNALTQKIQKELAEARSRNQALTALFEQSIRARAQKE